MQLVQVRQLRDPLAGMHPDLTGAQIHVLVCLGFAQAPLPTTVLAHRTGTSAPTMTGIVDRLEKQGLVERIRDGDDRRVVQVAITAAGADVVTVLSTDFRTKTGRLLSCLSADEQRLFVDLITRIISARLQANDDDDAT